MQEGPAIPFCHTEFLQDFCIELGLQSHAITSAGNFRAEVEECDCDGQELERLCVWFWTWHGTQVALDLWADGTAWTQVSVSAAGSTPAYEIQFWPEVEGFSPRELVVAFRESIAVSSRLCYGESPLPILRRIWRHTGEATTSGTLERTGLPNPI